MSYFSFVKESFLISFYLLKCYYSTQVYNPMQNYNMYNPQQQQSAFTPNNLQKQQPLQTQLQLKQPTQHQPPLLQQSTLHQPPQTQLPPPQQQQPLASFNSQSSNQQFNNYSLYK